MSFVAKVWFEDPNPDNWKETQVPAASQNAQGAAMHAWHGQDPHTINWAQEVSPPIANEDEWLTMLPKGIEGILGCHRHAASAAQRITCNDKGVRSNSDW